MATHKKKKREVDPDAKPHIVWQTCAAHCFDCPQCGYFWGPEHEKWPGQPATWDTPGNQGGVRVRK